MSAINVLKQRSSAHLVTDAAGYDAEGYVEQFIQKQVALPHLSCVIGTRGDPRANFTIGMCLAALFESFDHLVEGIEDAMPKIMVELPENELNPRNELMICGWSAERARPEAYFLQTAKSDWEPDEAVAGDVMNPEANTLLALDEMTFTPAVSAEEMHAARIKGRTVRDMNDLDPAVDLLRVLEIQRRQYIPRVPGGPARHWIGGYALLTSVDVHGVHSRVIARWPDRVGDLIDPAPIDWDEWNAAHPLPGVPEQLSKLREEMLARKARKLARHG